MARVMIVDDAAVMRMMLKQIFITNHYEVIAEAESGREAIRSYQLHKPDLVTMDITMPDMDGIAAVKGIREIDPQAKIIMCSAMGQQQMVMDAMAAGASDFIVKPFHPDRVMQSVTGALN